MDDQLIQTFFNSNSYSANTRRLYTLILENYRTFQNISLEELLNEAEKEEDEGVKRRRRRINLRVSNWKANLEAEGKSPHTIKSYVNAVIGFYDYYDITPPKIKNKQGDLGLEQNQGRLLKREEIRKMVDSGDTRTRAIIYSLALTGLSQAELRKITIQQLLQAASDALNRPIRTIEDFLDAEKDLDNEILTIYITRTKVHHRFFTFIPPEATRQIIAYLRERLHSKNTKIRPTLEGKIFVMYDGQPITEHAMREVIVNAGEKAGFQRNKEGAFAWWRGHALRKYFVSTIKNKTGNIELAEWLIGHKPRYTDNTYWFKDVEDMKKSYIQALEFLSIDGGRVTDFQSKEYRDIMKHLDGVKWILELLDEDPKFRDDARTALKRRQKNHDF
ncbi:integrase [uncultured archaeal virus]|uniref:Integrase n=1 Tax=uncultured archaeal virus TaxID=1960247 RepID=A0ABM9HVJ9_9VIRU|nr:integrase [uncultured archaeal virus]CAI3524015.1 integrase [uncultured archaeal virus]CAI4043396.1 integrase [uncultured archaeal virus]